jgi:rod shape-determining protein MreD
MIRINYRYQILQFVVLVLFQVPVLHKYALFNIAFGFFYVGFLIFFPFRVSPFIKLTAGFLVGLLMDIFSNTPGMHAAAGVVIMFVKDYWLVLVSEEPEDEVNTSIITLGYLTAFFYLFPLIFVHHLIVFSVEYGRWEGYWFLLNRVFWSTVLSFLSIYLINLLIAPRKRRG